MSEVSIVTLGRAASAASSAAISGDIGSEFPFFILSQLPLGCVARRDDTAFRGAVGTHHGMRMNDKQVHGAAGAWLADGLPTLFHRERIEPGELGRIVQDP